MADRPTGYHEDAELFRDARRFTAAETSFSERLIEKDYFCSVALADLAAAQLSLAFQGGTCLSKVHGGFYRLSEDLDFAMSTSVGASRSERSRLIAPLTLLRHKLSVPGTEPVDVSRAKRDQLRMQLVAQMRPVLRSEEEDYRMTNSRCRAISTMCPKHR